MLFERRSGQEQLSFHDAGEMQGGEVDHSRHMLGAADSRGEAISTGAEGLIIRKVILGRKAETIASCAALQITIGRDARNPCVLVWLCPQCGIPGRQSHVTKQVMSSMCS